MGELRKWLVRVVDGLALLLWLWGIATAIWDLGQLERAVPRLAFMFGTAWVLVRFVLPLMVGRGQRRGEIPRPAAEPTATASCAGRIGLMRFDGPMLRVDVYQDRLVLSFVFIYEHTIMDTDLDSVAVNGPWLVIRHSAARTKSPVKLRLSGNDPICTAIQNLRIGGHLEPTRAWWNE